MGRTFFFPTAAISALVVIAIIAMFGPVFVSFLLIAHGNYEVRGHQDFAPDQVFQIKPAAEMEHLFEDCRHSITYAGKTPHFNSVAYFGERYVLAMQVPVTIQDKTT